MVQGVEPIRSELELEPLQVNCSGEHGLGSVLESVLVRVHTETAHFSRMFNHRILG